MGTGLSPTETGTAVHSPFRVFFSFTKTKGRFPACVSASAAPASFSLLTAAAASVQMGPRLGGSPERRGPLPAAGSTARCRVPGDRRPLPGSLATRSSAVLPAQPPGLLTRFLAVCRRPTLRWAHSLGRRFYF